MARRIAGRRRKGMSFVATVLLLIILAVGYLFADNKNTNPFEQQSPPITPDGSAMTVKFMDVGQGDSTLIVFPDSKTALIDAANPGDGEDIVNYLSNLGVSKIDYVIATHPHADHIGGMAYIISHMEVGQIFAPRVAAEDVPTSKTYETFLNEIKENSLKLSAARGGNILFEGEGYRAECLAPNKDRYDGLNNYSVVVKIVHGQNTLLFTGDAESDVEEELVSKAYDLNCDLLKVGHHGSSSSSTEEFLEKVSPKYAVISCGRDNSYGHPHGETLRAFDKLDSLETLYRTDVHKTVTAVSDGKGNFSFETGGGTVAGED